jgi:hypothetical protein
MTGYRSLQRVTGGTTAPLASRRQFHADHIDVSPAGSESAATTIREEEAMSLRLLTPVAVFVVFASLFGALPANAQWELTSGDTSIKFGFLVQARAESLETGDVTAENLFFRRLRLIAGGKLSDRLTFFFETDSPNLGKGEGPNGTKNTSDLFIQDFVLSYRFADDQFVDVGMILPALSHHAGQGATSLMATDYGPHAFLTSGPLGARVGRDYGVRARGYVLGDHLEYRAGVYQGVRGPGSSNSFRFAGRLVYNVFEAEKGLFYGGTYLGTKKVLSFGASLDHQEGYDTKGLDVYFDGPMGNGNSATFQANWMKHDGGSFLAQLPEQDNLLVEAGYHFGATKLMPFVQYSARDFKSPAGIDEDKLQVGLGWMFQGHGRNLKLSLARITPDVGPDSDELWLQFQVLRF